MRPGYIHQDDKPRAPEGAPVAYALIPAFIAIFAAFALGVSWIVGVVML
jgi:hypothetical protein